MTTEHQTEAESIICIACGLEVDRRTQACPSCGVGHDEECETCKRRGYHARTCATMADDAPYL